MAWNDPTIGIVWPHVQGEYPGNAAADGYVMDDGTRLNLSEKDQKWGIMRFLWVKRNVSFYYKTKLK